ncbi:carboxylesterase family protein, partial [uncultured Desulfovibrio sp.]|uniref:carboxylesterase family protein n=1 Tax=uncultured Desulfovibrio sp. TaxID=167968 RepID=UPI002604A808
MGVAVSAALLTFSPSQIFSADGPVIQTPKGKVRGMVKDGVDVFLGVPAGKPPYEAGTRLKEAQFVEPWKGVVDCFRQ